MKRNARRLISQRRYLCFCAASIHGDACIGSKYVLHCAAARLLVLYSSLSSNSPLEGPRVLCSALLSRIFFNDSTDCFVSARNSFIFQQDCNSKQQIASGISSKNAIYKASSKGRDVVWLSQQEKGSRWAQDRLNLALKKPKQQVFQLSCI